MAEPVLRRGAREDTEQICALLRRCFPDNPKGRREVYDWQYWDNPFGPPSVWVWADGERIVGHYGAVAYPARLAGRPGVLGIGIDAAVDPDHQGRRLFGRLADALYTRALAEGMDAMVGYPNDNSVRGATSQGWHELGLLRASVLPLRPQWLARRTGVPAPVVAPALALLGRRSRVAAGAEQTRQTGSVEDADDLWAQVSHELHSGVVRDARWLRWRYLDRPGPTPYRVFEARRDGRTTALAVTTEQEQQGGTFTYLLELLATDDRAARAVVGRVAADSPGSDGLVLATLRGTALARRAVRAGLLPVPQRLEDKRLHFGVMRGGPELHQGWSLAWGDLDHL